MYKGANNERGWYMKIQREDFKNEKKKLKKHKKEWENYEKIIIHIRNVKNYNELSIHPFSIMYGFEKLKHFEDEFYSFNLQKNKGVIRLIFNIDKKSNTVILKYISVKHYEDFKRKIRN